MLQNYEPKKPKTNIGGKVDVSTIKEIMCKVFGHRPKKIIRYNHWGIPVEGCPRCKK